MAPLTIWQYEKVCRQGAIEEAAGYEGEAGNIHPIVIFERAGADTNTYDTMTNILLKLPEPWMVDYQGDATKVELVACITRIAGDFIKTCDFKDDDHPGKTYLLDIYDASYEVKILTARGGKELGNTTLAGRYDACPLFYLFSEDKEKDYADLNGADLQAFLEKYVQP